MKTVKEVIDEYLKSQNEAEQYSQVIIRSDGVNYTFEYVTELQRLSNYILISEQDYKIRHSTMICGHITYFETEITGTIVSKTRKVGKGMYQGD